MADHQFEARYQTSNHPQITNQSHPSENRVYEVPRTLKPMSKHFLLGGGEMKFGSQICCATTCSMLNACRQEYIAFFRFQKENELRDFVLKRDRKGGAITHTWRTLRERD